MKSIWREIVMALIMGMILPGIVLNWAVEEREDKPLEQTQYRPSEPHQTVPSVSLKMKLRKRDGTVEVMDMDEYLVGVVLAEMPSTFEAEAKKAQSVVARTFTRKAWVSGGKHGDGSVCTESACCQAYISETDYLAQGGAQSAIDAARKAVNATSGYVVIFEGELIEATYFSCSGGVTEDAVAVWGTDFPYLRSVESPGEEYAVHYTDTMHFTKSEFADKLGLSLDADPKNWIGAVTHTDGGGVNTIYIGGKSFEGTRLRSLLGLRSTVFTMEADESGITVVTKGFGHRVGMSQYGADAMAASGSGYEEILSYYYQGTQLELTNPDG